MSAALGTRSCVNRPKTGKINWGQIKDLGKRSASIARNKYLYPQIFAGEARRCLTGNPLQSLKFPSIRLFLRDGIAGIDKASNMVNMVVSHKLFEPEKPLPSTLPSKFLRNLPRNGLIACSAIFSFNSITPMAFSVFMCFSMISLIHYAFRVLDIVKYGDVYEKFIYTMHQYQEGKGRFDPAWSRFREIISKNAENNEPSLTWDSLGVSQGDLKNLGLEVRSLPQVLIDGVNMHFRRRAPRFHTDHGGEGKEMSDLIESRDRLTAAIKRI